MKLLLFIAALQLCTSAYGRLLPDYIEINPCDSNESGYEKCLIDNIEAIRPFIAKGIPEINLPPMDPFIIPYARVDQQLNEMIKINAAIKNAKVTGMNLGVLQSLKVDLKNLNVHVKMFFPENSFEMEYDVNGQLLIIPLQSKGYFTGNFSNTTLDVRASLTTVEREGEKYLKIKKIDVKSRVGDGVIKLISKNPSLQFAADLIANFYNQNPRLVMDAINPIYVATAGDLYRSLVDPILIKIPAKELIP